MAKQRAKRSNRFNPRQDRNAPEPIFTSKSRGGRRDSYSSTNNVIDFPVTTKKKHIEIIPRNINQENLIAALENSNKHIVFATGPAGTGKTLLATLHAVKCLKEGLIRKIVITRPNIAVDDKDIGYLPGDILSKNLSVNKTGKKNNDAK